MVPPGRRDALAEARLALSQAEKARDAAAKGSEEYRAAVRQVGYRWTTIRRLLLRAGHRLGR